MRSTLKVAKWSAAVAAAAGLAGCVTAGLDRMTQYSPDMFQAKTAVDGRTFSLAVHPRDQTILVQRATGSAIAQSAVRVASLGALETMEPKPYWRRAAEWLASPVGCTVTDVYPLDNQMIWEATYACPAGVDLRAEVKAHRESLRRGEPLAARAGVSPSVSASPAERSPG